MEPLLTQSVWGWPIALYLFLGGLGAGVFATNGFVYLATKGACRKGCKVSIWIAAACLVMGLLLLLSDVERPVRVLLLWQSFSNATSWMTLGAWLLLIAVVVFLVCAMLLSDGLSSKVLPRIDDKKRQSATKALVVFGIVLSFGVASYTGVLLSAAPGVPFWNSSLLPCLFVASALDTGVALTIIVFALVEKNSRTERRALEVATIALVVVEVFVLVFFLSYMHGGGNEYYDRFASGFSEAASASAGMVLHGRFAAFFWVLVIIVGLIVPFVAAGFVLTAERKGEVEKKISPDFVSVMGAVGALIGGCALRFVILLAGCHANVVVSEIAQMIL